MRSAPLDEKEIVIDFHRLNNGNFIKILNNKKIKIVEKNGSEKSIDIDSAPDVKKDGYILKTFIAEGEDGLIALAYQSSKILVILDLKKMTVLKEHSFVFPPNMLNPLDLATLNPTVIGLYALPNGAFEKNNNFIIQFNGWLGEYIFSYQNSFLSKKLSGLNLPENFPYHLRISGVICLQNQKLLRCSRSNKLQLLDSDLKPSKAELYLSPEDRYSRITSKLFPISKLYTACITEYAPRFDGSRYRLHVFSNDLTWDNSSINIEKLDRNLTGFNALRHVLFNGQYVGLVIGEQYEDTISIRIFDLKAQGKQVEEFFIGGKLFTASTPDGKLITCDSLGKITEYRLLPLPEYVKIKEKTKAILINKMPKDILNIITDYCGTTFNKPNYNFEIKESHVKEKAGCIIS